MYISDSTQVITDSPNHPKLPISFTNMKFLLQASALLSILATLTPILAAPTEIQAIPMEIIGNATNAEERDNAVPTLYACDDPNWSGHCLNMKAEIRTCYNLVDGWGGQISSAGPDKTITCALFSLVNCEPSAHQMFIRWPGISDMRDIGFDNAAWSFECYPSSV